LSATVTKDAGPAPERLSSAPIVEPFRPPRPRQSLSDLIAKESANRRRHRVGRWVLLITLPLLGIGVWLALRPRPVPFAARFRVQPVTQGDVVREVTATGNVEAVTTVQVGAEISGRIATVAVDYNDRVRAGQVLARFDRTLLAAQLAQTDGAVAAARAAVEQARTNRDKAAIDSSRTIQLWEFKGVTDADRDAALSTSRLSRQALIAAEAQLEASQAANAVARTNLDHTVIRAPIDGIIITRNIDPGQTVASALQTPVLFTVAADLRRMQVVAAVDEADVGEVLIGQSATFTVTAYPDRLFHGVVTQVRNSPVIVQDVVTYGTVVQVDNADLALKPGMTASVRIRIAATANALRVPNAALLFSPPGHASPTTPGVWQVADTALRRVNVHPGISDGELTAVSSGDLAAGASVAVGLTPQGRAAFAKSH